MTRVTFETWFQQQPSARDHAEAWVRFRRGAIGQRKLLDELRVHYGCQLRSQPALLSWLHATFPEAMGSRPAATPKAAPAPKVSLASITHERTAADVRDLEARGTYLVTCAQNNTPADAAFLSALETYADYLGAALLVIPIRYKNPTSRRDPQEDAGEDYWWDERLHPYLIENELRVHPLLRIMADVRIQATSPQPLNTLDSRSQDASAIYGHPQLQMRTVATPHRRLPKILYTTGAVTQRSYSSTKAGDQANFHHSNAAILAEVRGDRFHLRELVWDRTSQMFADLDLAIGPESVDTAPPVLALVTGDEHVWFHSREVREATYDAADSICAVLRPPVIVRHDVLDCYSVSPFHGRNAITRAVKARSGRDSLQAELDDTLHFIEATTPEGVRNVIVAANHHEQLTRWLRGGETAVEPKNAALYHWLMYRILEEAEMGDHGVRHPDPLELYARDRLLVPATFLGPDDSFQVAGIELGMHGHLGPNGARGSVRNLSTIGARSIIGHVHAPGIYQGVYAVGTSSNLRLEYNAGPSSWLNTHAVIHANGKRQMIHVIAGHWRAGE